MGFACSERGREENLNSCGEVSAICVKDSYHRRGIGKKLFIRAVDELQKQSFFAFVVYALEQNPACRFYEALGGRKFEHKPAKIGDEDYPGLFYVWDDLVALTQPALLPPDQNFSSI